MPVMQGLQFYNDKMLTMAEHWDDFIKVRTLKQPNIWHDRIPRGAYQLFNGLEQKTNIYRGGLLRQGGLSTWKEIGLSRKAAGGDAGFDNCAPRTPSTYSYSWETVSYNGYEDQWQSEPVCLNDMKFVDKGKEQLSLVIRTGVEYGVSMLENWNREMYVQQARLSGRCMVMASGALEFEDNAVYQFTYDPFATTANAAGDLVPYIKFDASLDVSTLNWDFLDYLRTSMADRCGEAALAQESGMPVFGLMIDLIDFEKMVKADPELREDWRYTNPKALIEGYGMGMKTYRGFALMHDARQMRFSPLHINADGDMVCTRVLPQKAGRAATIGNVPEPNPAYYRGEVGVGVIFMNDVLQNLFVPSLDGLGSGMTFGPAPGLTGEWKWINIPDNNGNQFGESGYFYGRFQLFPKPLLFAHDATVFIYKRCPQALSTKCVVQSHVDAGAGPVAMTVVPVAADFDATNRRVTLTLAKVLDANIGDAVTINTDDGDDLAAVIMADALAPKYTFSWASGAANAPAAVTELDDPAIVTVTVS